MSQFERDQSKQTDPKVDPPSNPPGPSGSNADAADSAAHIAELVRRTAERRSMPNPSSVARPDVTIAQQPTMAAPSVTRRTPTTAPTPAQPDASSARQPAGPGMRWPSRPRLVTAGAVAAVLIGGAVALSHPFDADPGSTSPTVSSSVPAGYTVKITDVITDCVGHARGQAKASFEAQDCVKATRTLATGQVGGRPVLFVASRIEMATAEEAASLKQVLDGSGTGNLNDLLREGKTFAGAPAEMPASGYASVQTGKVVTVAEAGFTDGGTSASTDAALRAAAAQVATVVNARG